MPLPVGLVQETLIFGRILSSSSLVSGGLEIKGPGLGSTLKNFVVSPVEFIVR